MGLNISQEREDLLRDSLEEGMVFYIKGNGVLAQKEISDGGTSVIGIQDLKFTNDHSIHITEVGKKTVHFVVVKEGEDQKKFDFNKLLFIQRFRSITDLEEVINAKDREKVTDIEIEKTKVGTRVSEVLPMTIEFLVKTLQKVVNLRVKIAIIDKREQDRK